MVGREAWKERESRVMPRNSRDVLSPSFSPGETEISSWRKADRSVEMEVRMRVRRYRSYPEDT